MSSNIVLQFLKEITMIFVSTEKKFQVRLGTVLTFLSGVGVPLPCVNIISQIVRHILMILGSREGVRQVFFK